MQGAIAGAAPAQEAPAGGGRAAGAPSASGRAAALKDGPQRLGAAAGRGRRDGRGRPREEPANGVVYKAGGAKGLPREAGGEDGRGPSRPPHLGAQGQLEALLLPLGWTRGVPCVRTPGADGCQRMTRG